MFFLFNGQWVQGEASKGWGPLPYETEEACQTSKVRAEGIHANLKQVNQQAVEKRFECIAEQTKTND